MGDPYTTCPKNSVFPAVFGFKGTSPEYNFSNAGFESFQVTDLYNSFLVAAGPMLSLEIGGQQVIPDLEVDVCEGAGCSSQPDWGSDQRYQGSMHFYDLDNYSNRKQFLLSHTSSNASALPKFVHLDKSHPAVAQAGQSWGLNLSSGEEVQALGAAAIIVFDSSPNTSYFLRMFAVVRHLATGDLDIRWRQQTLYPNLGADLDVSGIAMGFIQNNEAGSPLNFIVLSNASSSSGSRSIIFNDNETETPTVRTIDHTGLTAGGSYQLQIDAEMITARGRYVMLGSVENESRYSVAMIFQQTSPSATPSRQLVFNKGLVGTYEACVQPDETTDSSLILIRKISQPQKPFMLDFIDGTQSTSTLAWKKGFEISLNNGLLQNEGDLTMACNLTDCFACYTLQIDSQQSFQLIKFTLNSSLDSISATEPIKKISLPHLNAKYTPQAFFPFVGYSNGSLDAYMTFASSHLGYTRNGSFQTIDASPSQPVTIFSTRSQDCYQIMEEQVSTDISINLQTASAAAPPSLNTSLTPPQTSATVVFEQATYYYKIFRHHVSTASSAPMVFAPYFDCQFGSLLAAQNIAGATLTVDPSSSDQSVHLLTLSSLATGADGQVCRNSRPIVRQTTVTASYEGGAANAPETSLTFAKTRSIYTEVDCAGAGVSDATECAAYTVLTQLTKLLLPNYPTEYNFTSTVPAYKASLAGLKVKIQNIGLNFEIWQGSATLDWTVAYPSEADVLQAASAASAASEASAASAASAASVASVASNSASSSASGSTGSTTTTKKFENLLNPSIDTSSSESAIAEQSTSEVIATSEPVTVVETAEEQIIAPTAEAEFVASVEQLSKAEGKDQVQNAVATLLGVQDVVTVIKESQDLLPFDDLTDFSAAAEVDVKGWLQKQGLKGKYSGYESKPPQLLQKAFKAEYAVPIPRKFTSDGNFSLKMSSKIKLFDPTATYLKSRRLSTEGSSDSQSEWLTDAEVAERMGEIEAYLKLSGSIKMVLVPPNELYAEKKGFEWSLTHYGEDSIAFKVDFSDPVYITGGELNTMQLTLDNTDVFMKPADDNLLCIPSGYTIAVKLPPQGANVLSESELESAQSAGQYIVIAQLLLSIAFSQILQAVFGSILVVQIMAHLPMTDINMSVNVLQKFQIMISIVSFDYFPPFNYIDAKFTEVWAWSPNFEWIGFSTVNFLVGLGSIAVFTLIQILFIIVLLVKLATFKRCPCRWAERKFSSKETWSSSLTLIHGTFFEFMACACLAMTMVPFWDDFIEQDQFSIVLAVICLFLLCVYLVFIVFFACCRSRAMALKQREEEEERNLARCKQIHFQIKVAGKEKGWTLKDQKFSTATFAKSLEQREKRIEEASRLAPSSFLKYEPLVEDMKEGSQPALLSSLFLNMRRLTLLFMAMFVVGFAWVQLQLFIALNFAAFTYVFVVRPYAEVYLNRLNIFNELIAVLISYVLLALQDVGYDPEQQEEIGEYIVQLINLQAGVNVGAVVLVMVLDLKPKAQNCYRRKCRKRKNTITSEAAAEQAEQTSAPAPALAESAAAAVIQSQFQNVDRTSIISELPDEPVHIAAYRQKRQQMKDRIENFTAQSRNLGKTAMSLEATMIVGLPQSRKDISVPSAEIEVLESIDREKEQLRIDQTLKGYRKQKQK